jgi:uncharacterized integral membrane protein
MDAKQRMQMIVAGSILTLLLASFVASYLDRTYQPPVALIALGTACVTWLFGSAVRDEVFNKTRGPKGDNDSVQ